MKISELVLAAVDAWGLLSLWQPHEPTQWSGQTIRWLLAEICAKVGLGYEDGGDTELGRTLARFQVNPRTDGAQACRQLLELAGSIAIFRVGASETVPSVKMRAFNLYGYSPASHVSIGDQEEVLLGEYTLRRYEATAARTHGDATGSASEADTQSMALGLRLKDTYQDHRITASAMAADHTTYAWALAINSDRQEVLTVPIRPEVELYDTVDVNTTAALIPPATRSRQAVRIQEHYHAKDARATTTLTLRRK